LNQKRLMIEREKLKIQKMSEGHVIRMKKSLVICSQREECVSWSRELNGGKNTMKIMNVKAILEKEKYKKFPK